LPFDVTNAKVDLPELQGDPVDVSKEKCSTAAREVGGAVITEDTSLCFRALKGLPGPYIKWFLDSLGLEGLNNLIASSDDKSAYAQTIVAFCPAPGEDVVVFDGRTMGKIVKARGSLEFGWDPVFEPDEGNGLTYAEMSKDQKDAISHRSRAFSQLRDYFVKEQKAIVDKM
jgi:inosine triphosphate pyrophosphatase